MNQNNYNSNRNNMDGRPPSNVSGNPGGMEQNFLQQLLQQQQQQQQQPLFFPNQNMFNNQAVAAQGLAGYDPSQMMVQAMAGAPLQQPQQQQQQQLVPANLYPFANGNGQANLNVNPFQVNMNMQPTNPIQNPHMPSQQGNANDSGGQLAFLFNNGTTPVQPSLVTNNTGNDSNLMPSNHTEISDIGGVSVPPMAAGTPTLLHVEAAANAAASAAAPSRKRKAAKTTLDNESDHALVSKSKSKRPPTGTKPDPQSNPMSASATALIDSAMEHVPISTYDLQDSNPTNNNMTPAEKAQSSRDRNREHARCTRLRKKAYVNKLKELVEGLHAERSEDGRKRRAAIQALASVQEARRRVIHKFLEYHCKYVGEVEKWREILEEDFWMKQPVTPFRSFRRCEIDKVCCCVL
jgi:hypothetical protein